MKLCQCLCVCIKRYPKGAGQDFTANDKRLPLAAGDGSNKSRSGESLSSTILSASTLAGWLAGRANKQDRLGRGRHSQSSQQHPVPFPSERFHLPMLLLSQVFSLERQSNTSSVASPIRLSGYIDHTSPASGGCGQEIEKILSLFAFPLLSAAAPPPPPLVCLSFLCHNCSPTSGRPLEN